MPFDTPTIDIIVRFHDPEKCETLSRALFSIYGQTYEAVQPLLILQDFSPEQVMEVERMIDGFAWNRKRRRPLVRNYMSEGVGDHRSALLNEGLRSGRGRYIAILDYDDVVYRHAYGHLIRRLDASNAAIAFGRIAVKHVYPLGRYEYVQSTTRNSFEGDGLGDLLRSNFCPIHSFVLDRSKIADEDLYFDETMIRMEDYDFLLRTCVKYPSDFSGLSRYVGIYYWRIDGSNTIEPYHQTRDAQNDWDAARERIDALKLRLGIGAETSGVVE